MKTIEIDSTVTKYTFYNEDGHYLGWYSIYGFLQLMEDVLSKSQYDRLLDNSHGDFKISEKKYNILVNGFLKK